ncbi:DnaJ C-terminal domain-containing protein [Acinetobacter tianfuensis]|uniref:J domain-containing protein n=1 Tax=Acinetobacter tianfuensis TaxID=2419603 RepID=A0A3A8E9J3_9GAMM|nr:J domain-containing protein [Acinetobacter tianfuensis]RKG31295.1 J domain-containing protein [Acinetobacter tianfuensis]
MPNSTKKNYYEILGVNRDSTSEQIKKAYRKLARKYHPDISKEADAETRMQEINVAYDTLSDETKKKEYDFQLDHPEEFTHFSGGHGSRGGFDDAAFYRQNGGQHEQTDFQGFEDLFGRFGSGFGGGQQRQYRQQRFKGEDQHASIEADLNLAYHGGIQKITLQIPTYNNYGEPEVQRKILEVKIPKGLKDGQQIRLNGQGQAGINGGENGDLYIQVHYPATHRYRVDGADVYFNVDISPWEAALGQSIEVHLPDGSAVQVHLPANSHTGQQLRLKEKGIPNKVPGHLYLVLNIVLPVPHSEKEKQAYQAFAESFSQFKPRQS